MDTCILQIQHIHTDCHIISHLIQNRLKFHSKYTYFKPFSCRHLVLILLPYSSSSINVCDCFIHIFYEFFHLSNTSFRSSMFLSSDNQTSFIFFLIPSSFISCPSVRSFLLQVLSFHCIFVSSMFLLFSVFTLEVHCFPLLALCLVVDLVGPKICKLRRY